MGDRELALQKDPHGGICWVCGNDNYNFDDIGWFYNYVGIHVDPSKDPQWALFYKAVCKRCNKMPPGDR